MSTTTEGTVTKKLSASYADSIKAKIMTPTTVGDIIDTIKTDSVLSEKIKNIRLTEEKAEKNELKKELPFFNLGILYVNIYKKVL